MISYTPCVPISTNRSKKKGRTIRFGEGTILGAGILLSKMHQGEPGAWLWKDEIVNGEPSVGAVSPVTIRAASRRVEVKSIRVDLRLKAINSNKHPCNTPLTSFIV